MKKMTSLFFIVQLFLINMSIFADETSDLPPPDQSIFQTLALIVVALLFFYLILWRPEQKRRKALDVQRSSIKKGDRVTAMGIVGTVSRILDQTIILKMYDGSKIEVLKGAISDVIPGTEEDAKKADKEDEKDKS